jgi:hypothetical protein
MATAAHGRSLARQLLEVLEQRWREPDEGIWEIRDQRRHWRRFRRRLLLHRRKNCSGGGGVVYGGGIVYGSGREIGHSYQHGAEKKEARLGH